MSHLLKSKWLFEKGLTVDRQTDSAVQCRGDWRAVLQWLLFSRKPLSPPWDLLFVSLALHYTHTHKPYTHSLISQTFPQAIKLEKLHLICLSSNNLICLFQSQFRSIITVKALRAEVLFHSACGQNASPSLSVGSRLKSSPSLPPWPCTIWRRRRRWESSSATECRVQDAHLVLVVFLMGSLWVLSQKLCDMFTFPHAAPEQAIA